jgi:hypothetical protein
MFTSPHRNSRKHANRRRHGLGRRIRRALAGLGVFGLVGLLLALGQWILPDPLNLDKTKTSPTILIPPPTTSIEPLAASVSSRITYEITRNVDADLEVGFIFDKSANEIPSLDELRRFRTTEEIVNYMHSKGGIDGFNTSVTIVVQGRDERSVVLTGVNIRILERRKPHGTYVDIGGGADLPPRLLSVDLDDPRPIARPRTTGSEAWSFPLQVSTRDPEVFILTAQTSKCDCKWVAELDYVASGKRGSVRIDDNGKPFRTAAVPLP